MTSSSKRRKKKLQRKLRNRQKPASSDISWRIDPSASRFKMSEVIQHVAQPLLDQFGDTPEGVEKIIMLTITAWNIAVLPESLRDGQFHKLVQEPFGRDPESLAMWHWACDLVAERKQELYPRLNRFILDVKFRHEDNDEVYFEVIHTPLKEKDGID